MDGGTRRVEYGRGEEIREMDEGGNKMNLDATTTVIAIGRCGTCPFSNRDDRGPTCEFWMKSHTVSDDDERYDGVPFNYIVEKDMSWAYPGEETHIAHLRCYPKPPPDWCPLRDNPVIVMVDQED